MATVVDTIKTIYKELYKVKFVHTGYGSPRPNSISDDLTVQPDADTRVIFNNHNIGYHFFNDTLVVFIRCADQTPPVPYLKLAQPLRLRFLLNVSNNFLNKTVVDPVGSVHVYQFSNQVNAGTGGVISMHTQGVNSDDLKTVSVVNPDENCFAVIDIYSSGAINSAYDLFSGASENLNDPGYSIPFISKI